MHLVFCGVVVIMIAYANRARGAPPGISPFGAKCGELTCGPLEHCAEGRCEPCDLICEPEHHNFDSSVCLQECQNYLHDSIYVKKGAESTDGLKGRVEQLELEVSIVTIICAILLSLLLACLLVCCFRNHRAYRSRLQQLIQRNKKSSRQIPASLELTHQNPHTLSPVLARRARPIGVPVQAPPSLPTIPELPPQTVTPIRPNTQEELHHPQTEEQPHKPVEDGLGQLPPVNPRQDSLPNQLPLNVNGLQSIAEGDQFHKTGQVSFIPIKNFPRLPGGAMMQVVKSQLDTHSDLRSPSEDCLLSYGENERFVSHSSPSPSPSELGYNPNGVMAPIYGIHHNTPVHEGNTSDQEPEIRRENDSAESTEVQYNTVSGVSLPSSSEELLIKDKRSFGSSSTISLDAPHIYTNPRHHSSSSSENNDSPTRRLPADRSSYYGNEAYEPFNS